MKTLAIVQARMQSTRLPGKVLMAVGRYPMLHLVLERAGRMVGDDCVVLAIPVNTPALRSAWPQVVEGPEHDVLTRYVQVARQYEADAYVRFTADCPLLDVAYAQHLIGWFQHLRAENSHGTAPALLATSPDLDGLDTEVFTRQALLDADANARGADREHVTSWMRRHLPTQLATMPLLGGPIRWSVDDAGGLEFVRRVVGACADCAVGVPHHTNAGSSIGGVDRSLVLDLHVGEGGGLVECTSADILRERMGSSWRFSS